MFTIGLVLESESASDQPILIFNTINNFYLGFLGYPNSYIQDPKVGNIGKLKEKVKLELDCIS